MSWLKRGSEAAKMHEQAEKEREIREEQNKKMWRFYLEEGTEGRVTFVDGLLTKDGLLDAPSFREHNLKLNGKYGNFFVCTQDEEPCPICEEGDRSYLISLLTVIDHRITKSRDGTKTYKDQPRLYAFKGETRKILQSIASKRGGLHGCTFDIMRADTKKSAACGSHFDFIEKNPVEELRLKFTRKDTDGKVHTIFVPAKYDEEITYRTAKELRNMGFGSGTFVGGEKPVTEEDTPSTEAEGSSGTDADYTNQL